MSGTMRPMDIDDTPMYGPRGLLVCGLEGDHVVALFSLLKALELADLPVSFAGHAELKTTVGELFQAQPDNRESLGGVAVIMSGITGNQLQSIMKGWRSNALPGALWATLTETSTTWPLITLLKHLEEERQEMSKQRNSTPPS